MSLFINIFNFYLFKLTDPALLRQPRTFIYFHFLKIYFKLLPILFNYFTTTTQTDIKLKDVSSAKVTYVFIDQGAAGICVFTCIRT